MSASQGMLSRRQFLGAASAAAVASAVSVATMRGTGKSDGPGVTGRKVPLPKQGYRLTDHVRNYYRTANT